MKFLEVLPARAQFRPTDPVELVVRVEGEPGDLVTIHGTVHEGAPASGARAAESFRTAIRLDGEGRGSANVGIDLGHVTIPDGGARGFGVEVETNGVQARTAFDIADHWADAPRYGFFSDFSPGEGHDETERRADRMLALHVNVVQFYDWMYSHHTLVPDTDEFVDPLGRELSLAVVRRKVGAAHARGMAAIGYGALYGAEREFADAHPDWLLYDGRHEPLQLADIFYLQDIRQVSPWRRWIIDQFRAAVRLVGFDGIHIDQYGYPKRSLSKATGTWEEVDLTEEFAGFVEQACREIKEEAPTGGSIFNLVNAWPIERTPEVSTDAATYIEVWEPYSTYRDLYDLVRRARTLRGDKHVILAAYLRTFHPVDGRVEGAMMSFRLAQAAIGSSGGFHLILGEGGGLLTEAYYPNYGTVRGADGDVVRRYADFVVRNTAALHASVEDASWTQVGPTNDVVLLDHPEWQGSDAVRYGAGAVRDTIWTVQRDIGAVSVVSLVNLVGIESDRWNRPQPSAPVMMRDIRVRAVVTGDVAGVWWDTPDDEVARARALEFSVVDDGRNRFVEFTVPSLDVWTLVWWERSA